MPEMLQSGADSTLAHNNVSFLQIEPTTRCNFTCRFCAGRHMPQRNMPLEQFEQTLRSFNELRHVELQGEGEPMLHPKFFEMAEMIRPLHPQAKISLITNGSMFSVEAVERILDIGFHKLSVSIESPDPEAFAEIRGGKLTKVLDGIRLLLDRRRQRRSGVASRAGGVENGASPLGATGRHAVSTTGPAVGFAITVLRRTIHELPRLLDLYDELGLDGGITLQPLQTMRAYAEHYSAEMRERS